MWHVSAVTATPPTCTSPPTPALPSTLVGDMQMFILFDSIQAPSLRKPPLAAPTPHQAELEMLLYSPNTLRTHEELHVPH